VKSYGVAAVCAAALLYSSSAAAQRGGCDRACLEGFLDFYVAAVVAHDATLLPLARDVKFTENGQRLNLDDGLWHAATERGAYALKLADVERGQAVLMATIPKPASRSCWPATLRVGSGWSTWQESLSSEPRN